MRRHWYRFHQFMDRHFQPVCKWLMILNVGMFLLTALAAVLIDAVFKTRVAYWIYQELAQVPGQVVRKFEVWRLITYSFLHADGIHLLFNMLMLYFFGSMVESWMGSRRFLRFYLIVVVGAALVHTVFSLLPTQSLESAMIGSSGGMYGILVAAAVYAPNQVVLFNFLLPIRLKYLVMILIGLEFIMTAGTAAGGTSQISHITHLSGALIALGLLMGPGVLKRRRQYGGAPCKY
ncbi:MAG: hypothetical protein Kow0059_14200 [Candidatus Sumerlaeia bacterium]